MDSRMYDTLNSIPLFQGMNGRDLNQVITRMQLGIECLQAGNVFHEQGELCQHLAVLIDGMMTATVLSPDGSYSLTEYLQGPVVLEPDILYGIQRTWGCTYTAAGTCHLMLIPKMLVSRMITTMEVFRINYLNTVCTLAARRRQSVWEGDPTPSVRDRIAHFIRSHALQRRGHVTLTIRMSTLGQYVGGTRALVSVALHAMQEEGLLTVGRGHIEVPDIETLH